MRSVLFMSENKDARREKRGRKEVSSGAIKQTPRGERKGRGEGKQECEINKRAFQMPCKSPTKQNFFLHFALSKES